VRAVFIFKHVLLWRHVNNKSVVDIQNKRRNNIVPGKLVSIGTKWYQSRNYALFQIRITTFFFYVHVEYSENVVTMQFTLCIHRGSSQRETVNIDQYFWGCTICKKFPDPHIIY